MALPSYAMNQASFPEMYERELVGPLFRPFAETIVGEAEIRPEDRILDIACGTGIVARLASERLGPQGRAVAVDVSAGMLAVARSKASEIDWREGDATALPLTEGEEFDVVFCQQGLQFFADKKAAAAHMRRALADGGRLAVSTWVSDADMPFLRELRSVAERHLGPVEDQRYSFGGQDVLEALLLEAGFRNIRSKRTSHMLHFKDGAPFVRMNAMALVGMSGAAGGSDQQASHRLVDAIAADSEAVLARFSGDAGLSFEMTTNVAIADS
jgi:ubiquinone/menaquinone biosynthesis C-methylase UbiE